MTLPTQHANSDHPTTDPVPGFDLDTAIAATADPRPWRERAEWHDRAACAGTDPGPFFSVAPPSELTTARCRRCPVRTQCAVDGMRMNLDVFLATGVDEICPGYGGLTPDEAWSFLGAVRAAAVERGVALYERAARLAERIVEHHRAGVAPTEIPDLVGASEEEVWDALIDHLSRADVSNRDQILGRCGTYPEGVSYKWVERRRRDVLKCAPAALVDDDTVAACDVPGLTVGRGKLHDYSNHGVYEIFSACDNADRRVPTTKSRCPMRNRRESTSAVEIRPGVGTLGMFRFMDYTAWHAIGEFVDNSVASWQQHKNKLLRLDKEFVLQIHISLDPTDSGELRIWDNAAGIAAADYARAFKPAERPPNQSSLARYGMGMKTAACWFTDHWRVSSKALGEDVERTVTFDVQELIRRGQEQVVPVVRAAKAADHWTELVLWNLHQLPVGRTVGKVKEYLSQMYRLFLATGDVKIYWGDEQLQYKERAVLVAPYHKEGETGTKRTWEKKLDFTLPKGERVTGRALLFQKGEQQAAGLHMFWRKRMIKGNLGDFYRPLEIFQFAGSYRVQRLLIELECDELEPTVDKKDFIWGRTSSTERELLTALKKELNKQPLPLLDQADHYRSKQVDRSTKAAASRAAQQTAQAVEERGAEELTKQVVRPSPPEDSLPPPAPRSVGSEVSLQVSVKNEPWHISIALSDKASDRNQWLEITERPAPARKEPRRLGIRISLTHPFTLAFATDPRSMALLVRLAAGIALAEIAAREAGGKNMGAVRRNLNELLLTVLADS